jgi:uncharacterized protein YdhG (YjbR/CyaY superfamily)
MSGLVPRNEKRMTVEQYLAALPDDKRKALKALRKMIKAAALGADECISYGIPAFRYNGKFLVGYGAAARHCAFYPGSVVQRMKGELRNYDISKGTIRFAADNPLPAKLVRKLVKLRLAETAR